MSCPSVVIFSLCTATSLTNDASTWTPGKGSNDIVILFGSPQTTLHKAANAGFEKCRSDARFPDFKSLCLPIDFLFRPISYLPLPKTQPYWSSFSSFTEFSLRASNLTISCFSPPLLKYSFLFFSFWVLFMKGNTEYLLCSRYCVKSSECRDGENIILSHRLSNLSGAWNK